MNLDDRLVSRLLAAATITLAVPTVAQQRSSEEELATKLNNPVASLIGVPFQFNWDHEFGPDRNGHKFQLNVQPVIPLRINNDWNLITRVIVPFVDQHIPFIDDGSQSGIGDITGEFFFAPKAPEPGGIIWGIGPAIIVPTDSDQPDRFQAHEDRHAGAEPPGRRALLRRKPEHGPARMGRAVDCDAAVSRIIPGP